MTSEQPLHLHEELPLTPAPEPTLALVETNAFTPLPAKSAPNQPPQTKANQIELDKSVEYQFQPFHSAYNQFRFKPIAAKPTKLVAKQVKLVAKPTKLVAKPTKLVAKPTNLVAKPNKLVVAKSIGKMFPNTYVNLDSFFKEHYQNNYAKQFGFYGW